MSTRLNCTSKCKGLSESPTLKDSCRRLTADTNDVVTLAITPAMCIASASQKLCEPFMYVPTTKSMLSTTTTKQSHNSQRQGQ